MKRGGIIIREYASFRDLEPLKERWNQLALQGKVGKIFSTYEWCNAFSETILAAAPKSAVCVLVAYLESQVVGIAPLALWPRRGILRPFNKLKFIGDPRSDYSDFLVDKEVEGIIPIFMEYLNSASCRVKWDELSLSQIPEVSDTIIILSRYAERHNLPHRVEDQAICLSLMFSKDKENKEELVSLIQQKKSIKQAEKKLSKFGKVILKQSASLYDMNQWLEYLFAQHIRHWVTETGKSIFMKEENKDFYRKLLQDMCNKGWLRFSLLLLDDKPIATHLGFLYDGLYYYYKPTFDDSYKEFSPGNVLLKRMIEDSVDEDVKEFNFGRGGEAYKKRFTNQSTRNRSFILYRNAMTKHAASAGYVARIAQQWLSTLKGGVDRNRNDR